MPTKKTKTEPICLKMSDDPGPIKACAGCQEMVEIHHEHLCWACCARGIPVGSRFIKGRLRGGKLTRIKKPISVKPSNQHKA